VTLSVVISTPAFGMGIDIEWCTSRPSDDVETYIQQSGRAGRITSTLFAFYWQRPVLIL